MYTPITHGLIDPLQSLGFSASAGVSLQDGTVLYAVFDQRSRRIMIVAHPARSGNMAAIALAPWTAAHEPFAGDLLDELIDPAHTTAIESAVSLLRNGDL